MKRIAHLLLLFISFGALAQTPQQKIVNRTTTAMSMKNTVELSGNLYTIGRSSNSLINQIYPTITVQDSDLNVYFLSLPHRGAGQVDRYEVIWNLVKTSGDELIFSGTNGELGHSGMYYFKTDAGGNIIWHKEIRTGTWGNQLTYGSVANASGGAFIVGTENGGSPTLEAQIVNIDSNGDTLWTRKVTASDGQNVWGGFDGTFTDQSNNLVSFLRHNDQVEILKIDPSGNVLDNFQYKDGDGNLFHFQDAEFTASGNYYCGIRAGANYESIILKTDVSGNVLWCKKYWETGDFFKMLVDSNGDLLITAKPTWGPNLNKSEVIKLDADGNVIKAMSYGKLPEDHTLSSDIIELNDHYYISGTRLFQSNSTGYQLCLDQDLNSGSCYQSEFPVWSSDITAAKYQVTTSIVSSMQPDILFYGDHWDPMTNYSSPTLNYNLNNTMIVDFELTGDDCGGSCIGTAEAMALGGDAPYSYVWSDGQTEALATGLCVDNELGIEVGDQFGCYIQDTILVPQTGIEIPICIVSVDSTSTKNIVVWEKPVTNTIEGFAIYRDVQGNYTLVGYVPYNDDSEFIDVTNNVNPNITSYRYKIAVIDTCGFESELSEHHETIHVTATEGLGGENNLIWDNYEGFDFVNYNILKDTTDNDINDFYVADQVSSISFTWSDLDPETYTDYIVEVIPDEICTSTKANDYNSSRSNRAGGISFADQTGLDELNPANFELYPNPNNGTFRVQSNQKIEKVELFDLTGKLIFNQDLNGNAEEFNLAIEPGMYSMKIWSNGLFVTKRVIIK